MSDHENYAMLPGGDDGDGEECVIGHVEVFRTLTADGGMRDEVRTDDGIGGDLDLPTAVQMLAIAQHTLLSEERPT